MRLTLWSVRLVTTVMALMAIAQPILIGSYMSGNYDMLEQHSLNGSLLSVMTMIAGVVVVLDWLVGRGPFWPVALVAVLFVLVGIQIGMGQTRNLAVHVPLGVALVGVLVWLACWSWTPAAKRRRPRPQQVAA